MAEVYLAVEYDGEGQGYYKVVRAFANREDADAYDLADEILGMDIDDGPVDVRTRHSITWWPNRDEWSREEAVPSAGLFENPRRSEHRREFGNPPAIHVAHSWRGAANGSGLAALDVEGWDKDLVETTYQQLRTAYLAEITPT